MGTIEEAYAKGYIHSGHIDFDSFRRTLSRAGSDAFLIFRAELEDRSLDDIHESMSWWACFQKEDRQPIFPSRSDRKGSKDKSTKAKRKIVKASRKQNRRKKR